MTFNAKGFFSANEVSYQHKANMDTPLPVTETYSINRTTLEVVSLWTYSGSNNTPEYGQCEIVEVTSNRKFKKYQ